MPSDAERFRWLRQFLKIDRKHNSWTCWLVLDEIPFRSKADDPVQLLDELIARFPLPPEESEDEPVSF